ncbi:MAG: macro domain-containing protein [Bacillota bacterium]|nr:macro domain-containing protein [Bacillota bacterium]
MPLQIIHKDITTMDCDAIVNPTDSYFSGGGGTDRAIHTGAGPGLSAECERLEPLSFGEVAVTGGYKLPCRYIIHTMGPVWNGGYNCESVLLRSCYMNALFKASELGAKSIAFPLISSGTFGFPKDKVLRIAIDAISDYISNTDKEIFVTVCVHDREAFVLSKEIALKEYIDEHTKPRFRYEAHTVAMAPMHSCNGPEEMDACCASYSVSSIPTAKAPSREDLSKWIKKQDDTFAVMLLKLIDEKGMTDVQCYKKANVSKGTFWKINNDPNYRPSKATVLAFAIALELSIEETEQLLRTVGLALSHSNLFDLIVEFYITNGNYDIYEINAALFKYDQVCIGC